MKKKAFVLLSGGLDSTTCLYQAAKDFYPANHVSGSYEAWLSDVDSGYLKPEQQCDWVEAVSIFYGQRHKRELDYAKRTCNKLGIKHTILDVGDLLKGKDILLSADSVDSMEMVHTSYDQIQGVSPSYVPFRNGLLLSAITAYAQKYVNAQIKEREEHYITEGFSEASAKLWAFQEAKDLSTIYYGAHAEDAANWAYPDCTPEFNGSMANAIYTGTYNTVRLATPLQWSKKYEIVNRGYNLSVDFASTWSCYDNKEYHCGECPTCLARKEAFAQSETYDPTSYLNEMSHTSTSDLGSVPF